MLDDKLLNSIADQIDCGFNCYIHRETLKLISIPNLDNHPDIEIKAWKKEKLEIENQSNQYFIFEPLEPFESFKIMERFIETVDNQNLRKRLFLALSKNRPFSSFKQVIDYSGKYRDKWFKFKHDSLVDIITDKINFLSNTEMQ
jgi:hypothetical protein